MTNQQKFSRICLIYLISLFCFVAVRILSALGVFNILPNDIADLVFTIIIQLIVMGLLPFFLYIKLYKQEKVNKNSIKTALNDIGFKKISIKTVILSILLGFCVYIFNIAIASFFDMIIAMFGYTGGSGGNTTQNTQLWYLFYSLFITAVMPGIFEEVIHRGILFKGVNESRNFKWAVLCSGLFFGLMHLNINQFFYATILGMLFAFLAKTTKNIIVPIILHFMNNAINVYLSWASASKSFGAGFYDLLNNFLKNNNIILVMICITCIMFVLAVITIYLIVALYNDNNKENKIYLRLLTPAHMKNYLQAKRNDIANINQETSINYSKCVSRENDSIPEEQSITEMFNIHNEKCEKLSFKYSVFFYSIFILGGLTTIFTFIWGIL